MSATIATALKHIDTIQTRLDSLLALLHETQAELRHAHRNIAQLEAERDTWRLATGR